jgi:uncharacterized damage-inducible protein DinB
VSAWILNNENEASASILYMHVMTLAHFVRQIPPDKLDFTYDQAAPTARTVATHALQWLICDRHHIEEPDATKHPRVPDPPTDPQGLANALAAEGENWKALLRSLTPEQMDERRLQFGESEYEMNVRSFVAHITQNTIYKSGQLSYLFYALGLDGTGPYEAPFPNQIYAELYGPKA